MNILAMVAHPDDEVLGAGGTLAKHVKAGDRVWMAHLTDGVGARGSDANKTSRIEATIKASHCIGLSLVNPIRSFPDNQMDSVPLLEVVRAVERYVEVVNPDIIYTHHSGDLNIDHRICNQAVLTACRPVPGSTVKAIYAMEIPSSTEWQVPNTFQPTRFVDIFEEMVTKIDAVEAYQEEIRPWPHARSFKAIDDLNKWRGATVGLKYAEAFMVLREIA